MEMERVVSTPFPFSMRNNFYIFQPEIFRYFYLFAYIFMHLSVVGVDKEGGAEPVISPLLVVPILTRLLGHLRVCDSRRCSAVILHVLLVRACVCVCVFVLTGSLLRAALCARSPSCRLPGRRRRYASSLWTGTSTCSATAAR